MILKKEIEILDNDIYVLGITERFVIVNNNYKGIDIYTKDFKFHKSFSISVELVIYHIYTSVLNNKVVISDVENKKLYIIDLQSEEIRLVISNQNSIFTDYYYVKDEFFELREGDYIYCFSYKDGLIAKKSFIESKLILSNFQDEVIYFFEGSVIYKNNDIEKKLPIEYADDDYLLVYEEKIIKYNEKLILVYNNLKLYEQKIFYDSFTIRKVQFFDNSIFVLLNSVETIYQSKIQEYLIEF